MNLCFCFSEGLDLECGRGLFEFLCLEQCGHAGEFVCLFSQIVFINFVERQGGGLHLSITSYMDRKQFYCCQGDVTWGHFALRKVVEDRFRFTQLDNRRGFKYIYILICIFLRHNKSGKFVICALAV